MRHGIGGIEGDRLVVARQSRRRQAETLLYDAAIAVRMGVVGPALNGLIVACERRVKPTEVFECVAALVVGLGVGRVERDCLVVQLHRALEILSRCGAGRLDVERIKLVRRNCFAFEQLAED